LKVHTSPEGAGTTGPTRPHGHYAPSTGARFVLSLTRRTFLGRGKARRVLGRAFERLHSGPVDTTLWGLPVRLYPDGNVSEKKALLNPARFNRFELDAITARLQLRGSVFVDIGANAGLFSLYVAGRAAPETTIIGVEPHPELFRRMRFNLGAKAAGVDLRLLPIGVGASSGDAVLHSDDHELGSGSIVDGAGTTDGIRVPMRRLADVLTEQGVDGIDVMKIDVEGYEDRVLQPFFETAPPALWPRAVVIEHLSRGDWQWDCIGEAAALGYRLRKLSKSNTLLELSAGEEGQ